MTALSPVGRDNLVAALDSIRRGRDDWVNFHGLNIVWDDSDPDHPHYEVSLDDGSVVYGRFGAAIDCALFCEVKVAWLDGGGVA